MRKLCVAVCAFGVLLLVGSATAKTLLDSADIRD
jgi:hypothetical protein